MRIDLDKATLTRWGRNLKAGLAEDLGVNAGHSQCLALIARTLGMRSHHVLLDAVAPAERAKPQDLVLYVVSGPDGRARAFAGPIDALGVSVDAWCVAGAPAEASLNDLPRGAAGYADWWSRQDGWSVGDAANPTPAQAASIDALLAALKERGCRVRRRGATLSVDGHGAEPVYVGMGGYTMGPDDGVEFDTVALEMVLQLLPRIRTCRELGLTTQERQALGHIESIATTVLDDVDANAAQDDGAHDET